MGRIGISQWVERGCHPSLRLVEDNPINREIMFNQLTSSGCSVDVASNGSEALRKYGTGSYDLILTDIEMPGMDGYELTATIRRLEVGTGDSTLILAITASEFDLSSDVAKARGFDGHMLKPLSLAGLEKKLSDLRHFRRRELPADQALCRGSALRP